MHLVLFLSLRVTMLSGSLDKGCLSGCLAFVRVVGARISIQHQTAYYNLDYQCNTYKYRRYSDMQT